MSTPDKHKYTEGGEGMDALFRYATEGILMVDDKGFIVRINPSAESLFGYDKDELLGKKIEILVPQRVRDRHVGHRNEFIKNPHARSMGTGSDLYGLCKNGKEFPVELSLSPFEGASGKYTIAFIIDVTIRKQAEENLRKQSIELEKQVRNRTLILEEAIEELEKTKKELYQALRQERELNELKSRFVSMASHEFRTPLTTMMSSLSLVKKYGELNDTENQEKYMNKIRASINNLTDILNDFLSVSKLEEGKVMHSPETLNLHAFLADVVSDMQSFSNKGHVLNYAHEGEEMCSFDPRLMKNVMINLISNAVKFSDPDTEVDVRSAIKGDEVTITVEDRGIGIPESDREHLFERFFRGQNASYIQGTGLGLSIVARYAELMKAKISVESKENVGSCFMLKFRKQ